MVIFVIIAALLGVLAVVAGIWYLTRNVDRTPEGREKKPWIDHSLDEWRVQREAEAEANRIARVHEQPKLHAGAAAEEQSTQKTHTRWGG